MLRVCLLITVLMLGQAFAGAIGVDASANETFGHTMTLFVHQLLLVYWLGPDIAIFIWGWSAVKAGLDVGQRIAAGKMMTTIDFVPRVCVSLFLTVAGILSATYGLSHPWWQMAGIILLGPVWLTIVLLSYLKRGSDLGGLADRFDFWLRGVLVVGIPISVMWSVSTGRFAGSPWIAGKLMIFAVVILLGSIMRLKLRAFFEGLNKLETDGQSEAVNTMIATSFARARPLWPAVWLLLLLASLMGIMKPGEQGSARTAAMTGSVASQWALVRSISSSR